jgi:hypothetical protein
MDLVWGMSLTLTVIGVLGGWFRACGRADRARQLRAFAIRTLRYAIPGFLLGIAFLNSDLGTAQPQGRLGLIAITVCCFLLLYAAGSALTAANDHALVVVNLTGRPLLLSDPELAPFYALPSVQEQPAAILPPPLPRTYYVVSAELGRAGAEAGRSDVFTVDPATVFDPGATGPLLVRRLLRVAAQPAAQRATLGGGRIAGR